ncbi:hypothetical protein SAMN04489716_3906 [Actinoplanes derwentensis]|uniref:Uncharacterized protein n=1 Tax=Actinoplanes derwentensis TaxID=113562 RepID=A0A1H2AJM6_9ACTN|nr:hypothetical protein SAMN04489716_3906 [Actinoplanes derwentensis]
MSQPALFSVAGMRDRTKSRNYSPERDEFRRDHERRRAWGLQRRHAEKLRQIRERDSMPLSREDREWLASLTPRTPPASEPPQNPPATAPPPPPASPEPEPAPLEPGPAPEPGPEAEPGPGPEPLEPGPGPGPAPLEPRPGPSPLKPGSEPSAYEAAGCPPVTVLPVSVPQSEDADRGPAGADRWARLMLAPSGPPPGPLLLRSGRGGFSLNDCGAGRGDTRRGSRGPCLWWSPCDGRGTNLPYFLGFQMPCAGILQNGIPERNRTLRQPP